MYGNTAQKYTLGLKASTYVNDFEWQNPIQEVYNKGLFLY
jgi:hypothetical protein